MNLKSTFKFPILPIVQKYLKTIIKGSNYWSVCPFHSDNSPSMSISIEKNIFKCFSCNESGDSVSFVMKIEKCGYATAIKKIGEILKINVNDLLSKKDNSNHKIFEINELICKTYHKCLFNTENLQKLEYLTQTRKLPIEIIKKYKLGYAPEKDILNDVFNIHTKKNLNLVWNKEDIKKTNIFYYKQDGSTEPYFKNRFIFPIFNIEGQIISFSGRGENPKYLNIKNTEVFSKKNSLFNINNLEKNKPIYIFEGFIDLMKTEHYLQISNSVACMGGNIDVSLFEVLYKFSKTINLCMDNDESGHLFTINLSKSLISYGFKVKIIDLLNTQKKDIDELIDEDLNTSKKLLLNPICFFEWFYKKKNPRNIEAFKLLLSEFLNTLFQNNFLKKNINSEYAKYLIEKFFNFYKNFPEYKNIEDLVEKHKTEYKKIIDRSVIFNDSKTIEFTQKSISSIEKFENITNPFTKLVIKYQNLLDFYNHHESEIENEPDWRFNFPEKYFLHISELKDFIDLLEKRNEDTIFLESIRKYKNHSLKIRNNSEFFDKYFSFYQECIRTLSKFYLQDKVLLLKDSWEKNYQLKIINKNLKEKIQVFFKNSSFYKLNF